MKSVSDTFLHLVFDAQAHFTLLATLPPDVLVYRLDTVEHLIYTREPIAGHFKADVKAIMR